MVKRMEDNGGSVTLKEPVAGEEEAVPLSKPGPSGTSVPTIEPFPKDVVRWEVAAKPKVEEPTEEMTLHALHEAVGTVRVTAEKRKRKVREIERKIEQGEQLSISDYAFLGRNYPQQTVAIHKTAEDIKASRKFYKSIGYAEYGGLYAPFTVPEGYKVKQIKETKQGLDIVFEPIYKAPAVKPGPFEEYKAKRGLVPAKGELYSLIAPTLISIRAEEQPRLSDILYGVEQPKGLLEDIVFVTPEKKLGVPERVVKVQPIQFFGGMVESVESVGELLFPYPVPHPERPLTAERVLGIVAGSLAMGEAAAKVFEPATVEIQKKAGEWLTTKYVEAAKAGELWKPGLKEKVLMKLLGSEPHLAKGLVSPPVMEETSLEGLKAVETAWRLEIAPRTSAVTIGKTVTEKATYVSLPHLIARAGVVSIGYLHEPLSFKMTQFQEPFPAELKEWIVQKPVYGVMPYIPATATAKTGQVIIPLLAPSLLGIQTGKIAKDVERTTGKISTVDLAPKVPSVKPELPTFPVEKVLPKILKVEAPTVEEKPKPVVAPVPQMVPSIIPKLGLQEFFAEKPKSLPEPLPSLMPDITGIHEKVKKQEAALALPEPLPKLGAPEMLVPVLSEKPTFPSLLAPSKQKVRKPQIQLPTPSIELVTAPKLKTPVIPVPKLGVPQITAQMPKQLQQLAIPSPPTLTVPAPSPPAAIPPLWLPRGGEPEPSFGRGLYGAWFKREHPIKPPKAMLETFGWKMPRAKKPEKTKTKRRRSESLWF